MNFTAFQKSTTYTVGKINFNNHELVVSKFLAMFRKLIVSSKNDYFETEGRTFLTEQLMYFIRNGNPIKMI